MKTQTLLDQLNEALMPLFNTRINDFGRFHDAVRTIIDAFLPKNLVYTTWYIAFIDTYSEYPFDLEIDLIEDKRVKFGRKGKLVSCKFVQKIDGTTIKELFENRNKLQNDRLIKQWEEHASKLRIQLKEAEDKIAQFKNG